MGKRDTFFKLKSNETQLSRVMPFIVFLCSLSTLFAQVEFPNLLEDKEEVVPKALLVDAFEVPEEEKVSLGVNRVFLVIGDDFGLRTQVIRLAEALRTEFLFELGEKQKEEKEETKRETQIQIQLLDVPKEQAKGSAFRKLYGEAPNGGHYLKLIVDANRMKTKELELEILKMLFLERTISGSRQLPKNAELITHDWMVDGFLSLMDWRAERVDKDNFLALSRNPKLFDLDKIFQMKRKRMEGLDKVTKKSYKAAAGALVMALLNQPNGKESMNEMLTELSVFYGESQSIIQQHFPLVNKGKNGIRVTWLLELAAMGVSKLTDSMSILETDEKLTQILNFQWENKDGELVETGIEGYELLIDLEEEALKATIEKASKKLYTLEARSFPLYRPMITAYKGSLQLLINKPEKGVRKKMSWKSSVADFEVILKNITKERTLYVAAAERSRDYLDWFAINGNRTIKGDLSSFEKVKENAEEQLKDSHISRYLNTLNSYYE